MKAWAVLRLGALLVACAGLGACAGAERFSGSGRTASPFGQARAEPALPPAPPIASAPVETQALPPPPGAAQAPAPTAPSAVDLATPGARPEPPVQSGAPTTPPPAPRQIEMPTLSGGAREVAVLGGGGGDRPAARAPVTGRDGVIGFWTAREANGGSCRVQLSSSPALDLYRANASGCSNRELSRVTAWDYRDGEVYLYQPGGSVAARLKANDRSSLNGVIARSGAQLSLTR